MVLVATVRGLCVFAVIWGSCHGELFGGDIDGRPRFSTIFQNHMVLERDAPLSIWGFNAKPGLIVTISPGSSVKPVIDGDRWTATFPAHTASVGGATVSIHVEAGTEISDTITDVVFGDVFLFSGQSNIDIPEAYAHQFNQTAQEIEEGLANELGHNGLVRIMIVPNQVGGLNYNATPAKELVSVPDCAPCPPSFTISGQYHNCFCNALKWTRPDNTTVRSFSATAWFTGMALRSMVPALKGVPVGLVRSSWGGTPIQLWSSPDAVAKCPQSSNISTSRLFNGMINPFVGLQWSAVIWYQGESNTAANAPFLGPEYYGCALPAMISDWREKLQLLSLPFLVVELSAYCCDHNEHTYKTWCDQPTSILKTVDQHLPSMRIAQAQAEKLDRIYVETAMDLGSLHPLDGSIHSDKKVELGRRLALAATAAVYNNTTVVWASPRALKTTSIVTHEHTSVIVLFDVNVTLNTKLVCPAHILPVFCTGAGFELESGGMWTAARSVSLGSDGKSIILQSMSNNKNSSAKHNNSSTIGRVRYAFADWPVVSVRGSEGNLPARIFDMPVSTNLQPDPQ